MARVLLVDDEPVLRSALRQYLEFAGHDVDEAPDGDDALVQARRQRPDIIVSDVLMPGRDGMSLASLEELSFAYMKQFGATGVKAEPAKPSGFEETGSVPPTRSRNQAVFPPSDCQFAGGRGT